MLLELQVKNLALIEQARVEFGEGLNILTGETGAGKSIIIGSVNAALGGKVSRDSIRQGADSAYIELLFSVDSQAQREALSALDVTPSEDGMLIVSRRILPTRSVSKINDETVTTARLRQITGLLMDIHGQHDHQSLLHISRHLEILDAYGKNQIGVLKLQTAEEYRRYRDLKARLDSMSGGQEERLREADFCRFEIQSIEEAALKEGEEEALSERCKTLSHHQKIMESLSQAYENLDGEAVSRAVRALDLVAGFDKELSSIRDLLCDAESLVGDACRAIQDYEEQCVFDEGEFRRIEERLDVIRGLQAKYGSSTAQVLSALETKKKRLEELENFDQVREQLAAELAASGNRLEHLCAELSEKRQKIGKKLASEIEQGLRDLNFLDVRFVMEFGRLDHFTAGGYDEPEFLISTNPGEPVKPLKAVASGGELSRIMLAIKTVLADTDEIPTLIFDEIDTGISGRTAQKVSEKLNTIAGKHQVICITHLPQIAAMADSHFEIEKSVSEGKTVTRIRKLLETEMVDELARLLGGAKITDAVIQNALEMKEMAERSK